MVDARREAVFIKRDAIGPWEDRTPTITTLRFDPAARKTSVRFAAGGKEYSYGEARAQYLQAHALWDTRDCAVFVEGNLWRSAAEVAEFNTPLGPMRRILTRSSDSKPSKLRPASSVQINAPVRGQTSSSVLQYFEAVALALPGDDDPTRGLYERKWFAHGDSALAKYLATGAGEPGQTAAGALPPMLAPDVAPRLAPFLANLSQREALASVFTTPISIIEGPPGTGKTETILNIVANCIVNGETVAVVSSNNSAVDNVREKLEKEGLGFVVAALGRKSLREEFFTKQNQRLEALDAFLAQPAHPYPDPARLNSLDGQLVGLLQAERSLAELEAEGTALELEQRHFLASLKEAVLPDLGGLALLKRSSGKILRYLADTSSDSEDDGPFRRLTRALRRYFDFGSTKGVDAQDTATVLELHRRYYEKRLGELAVEKDALRRRLDDANYKELAAEHQALSRQHLFASLRERYAGKRTHYDAETYRSQSREFLNDYPVVVSTCHSLQASLGPGQLVDYVIIDEASQLNLLVAAPALACGRNAVVVGDQRQLPHIVDRAAVKASPPAPAPAFDYAQHSLLSSMAIIGDGSIPRTLLREHYRCDSKIIGFCNAKFYDNKLIPYKGTDISQRAVMAVTTPPGNHMRSSSRGGQSNQREVDVIVDEIIPRYLSHVAPNGIGITTPYRRQVGKFEDALDNVQVDTVHKFQGRDKDVVILSAVVDETRAGDRALAFVDDPKMINVAVSRAKKQFILVTNHGKAPRSRHLRDLIGYIEYQNPDQPSIEGTVISVFDLLYERYADELRPLAARLKSELEYKSENIVLTVLGDLLQEGPYVDLKIAPQVLLRQLIGHPERLTDEQQGFLDRRASVDFVVLNRITHRVVTVIEVDGYADHENNPSQLARDQLKNQILNRQGIRLLRLKTTERALSSCVESLGSCRDGFFGEVDPDPAGW